MDGHLRLRRPASRARGFTLVELMIALAMVGILAAVALPSYLDSMRKGRRAEAFQALSAVQQAQERWRNNHTTYASNLSDAPPAGLGIAAVTSPGGYYSVSLGTPTGTRYVVTASAISGKSQANDGNCAQLEVEVNGGNVFYKSAAVGSTPVDDAAARRCWTR